MATRVTTRVEGRVFVRRGDDFCGCEDVYDVDMGSNGDGLDLGTLSDVLAAVGRNQRVRVTVEELAR